MSVKKKEKKVISQFLKKWFPFRICKLVDLQFMFFSTYLWDLYFLRVPCPLQRPLNLLTMPVSKHRLRTGNKQEGKHLHTQCWYFQTPSRASRAWPLPIAGLRGRFCLSCRRFSPSIFSLRLVFGCLHACLSPGTCGTIALETLKWNHPAMFWVLDSNTQHVIEWLPNYILCTNKVGHWDHSPAFACLWKDSIWNKTLCYLCRSKTVVQGQSSPTLLFLHGATSTHLASGKSGQGEIPDHFISFSALWSASSTSLYF